MLIPPQFGLGSDDYRRYGIRLSPSLITRLERDSLSYRILREHMKPGIWISSQTRREGSVLASLVPPPPPLRDYSSTFSNSNLSNQRATLRVSPKISNRLKLDISYHSHQFPADVAATLMLADNLKLSSQIDLDGRGWLACQFFTQVNNFFLPKPSEIDEYYKNNPFQDKGYDVQDDRKLNLHFGSWADIQVPKEGLSLSEPMRTIPAAHAYASLQVPGCLLAVEGTIPTTTDKLPQLSYYVAVDMNSEGPPMAVTLYKSPKSSGMGLSQVFSWDRVSLNPFETRAPMIRNTLAWTVELVKKKKEQSANAAAQPQAGVVWQLNRAVALKATATTQEGLSTALVLKHWKQPRITCACILGSGRRSGSGLEFQGLSICMEIGGESALRKARYDNGSSSKRSTVVSSRDVPETKATLPEK